jgi:hypothetical protein
MTDANTAEVIEDEVVEEVETETTDETGDTDSEVETEQEETDEDSSTEEEAQEKPEESSGVQKRIDALTREKYELRRELESLKNAPKPDIKPFEPGKGLSDFDYDEKAYSAYVKEEATQAAKAELQQQWRDRQSQQAAVNFDMAEAKFAAQQKDYDKVAHNPQLTVNENMAQLIRESDQGPQVLYHLGKNPEIADRLSRMGVVALAKEMGKIEATLSTVQKNAVSKSPPPTPKIPAATNKVKKAPDQMSQKEFEEYRRKIISKR